MSILIISRSENKLTEQANILVTEFKNEVKFLNFDFTKIGKEKRDFYNNILPKELKEIHLDGGIGVLVNNVGTANEHPKVTL